MDLPPISQTEVVPVQSEVEKAKEIVIKMLSSGSSINDVLLELNSSEQSEGTNLEISVSVSLIGTYQGYDMAGNVDVTLQRDSSGEFRVINSDVRPTNPSVRINNSSDIVNDVLAARNLNYASVAIRGSYQSYSANLNASVSSAAVTLDNGDVEFKIVMKNDGTFEEFSSNVQRITIPSDIPMRDMTNADSSATSVSPQGTDIPLPQARTEPGINYTNPDEEPRSSSFTVTIPSAERTLAPTSELIVGLENPLRFPNNIRSTFPVNTVFSVNGWLDVKMAINSRGELLVLGTDGKSKRATTPNEIEITALLEEGYGIRNGMAFIDLSR